jgi:hypothetical protein
MNLRQLTFSKVAPRTNSRFLWLECLGRQKGTPSAWDILYLLTSYHIGYRNRIYRRVTMAESLRKRYADCTSFVELVSVHRTIWPAQIFSSCFQRRQDLQSLDMKILEFLRAQRNSERWASRITPMTIRGLADASVETTELFLGSRITLISRVVSIYGRDTHTTANVRANNPRWL